MHGFARTLERLEPLSERTARYLGMIAAASEEMSGLLDRVSLVARIEDGRYEPRTDEVDSLELAHAAARQVEAGEVAVAGDGDTVRVDPDWAARSVAALAQCAIRHGGVGRLTIDVAGSELRLSPIVETAGPVVLGDELRDIGAAAACRLVEALGGSVTLDGETLAVRLPTSAAATGGGP